MHSNIDTIVADAHTNPEEAYRRLEEADPKKLYETVSGNSTRLAAGFASIVQVAGWKLNESASGSAHPVATVLRDHLSKRDLTECDDVADWVRLVEPIAQLQPNWLVRDVLDPMKPDRPVLWVIEHRASTTRRRALNTLAMLVESTAYGECISILNTIGTVWGQDDSRTNIDVATNVAVSLLRGRLLGVGAEINGTEPTPVAAVLEAHLSDPDGPVRAHHVESVLAAPAGVPPGSFTALGEALSDDRTDDHSFGRLLELLEDSIETHKQTIRTVLEQQPPDRGTHDGDDRASYGAVDGLISTLPEAHQPAVHRVVRSMNWDSTGEKIHFSAVLSAFVRSVDAVMDHIERLTERVVADESTLSDYSARICDIVSEAGTLSVVTLVPVLEMAVESSHSRGGDPAGSVADATVKTAIEAIERRAGPEWSRTVPDPVETTGERFATVLGTLDRDVAATFDVELDSLDDPINNETPPGDTSSGDDATEGTPASNDTGQHAMYPPLGTETGGDVDHVERTREAAEHAGIATDSKPLAELREDLHVERTLAAVERAGIATGSDWKAELREQLSDRVTRSEIVETNFEAIARSLVSAATTATETPIDAEAAAETLGWLVAPPPDAPHKSRRTRLAALSTLYDWLTTDRGSFPTDVAVPTLIRALVQTPAAWRSEIDTDALTPWVVESAARSGEETPPEPPSTLNPAALATVACVCNVARGNYESVYTDSPVSTVRSEALDLSTDLEAADGGTATRHDDTEPDEAAIAVTTLLETSDEDDWRFATATSVRAVCRALFTNPCHDVELDPATLPATVSEEPRLEPEVLSRTQTVVGRAPLGKAASTDRHPSTRPPATADPRFEDSLGSLPRLAGSQAVELTQSVTGSDRDENGAGSDEDTSLSEYVPHDVDVDDDTDLSPVLLAILSDRLDVFDTPDEGDAGESRDVRTVAHDLYTHPPETVETMLAGATANTDDDSWASELDPADLHRLFRSEFTWHALDSSRRVFLGRYQTDESDVNQPAVFVQAANETLTECPGIEKTAEDVRSEFERNGHHEVSVRTVQENPRTLTGVANFRVDRALDPVRSRSKGRLSPTLWRLLDAYLHPTHRGSAESSAAEDSQASSEASLFDLKRITDVVLSAAAVNEAVVVHTLDWAFGENLEEVLKDASVDSRNGLPAPSTSGGDHPLQRLQRLVETLSTIRPDLLRHLVSGPDDEWVRTWQLATGTSEPDGSEPDYERAAALATIARAIEQCPDGLRDQLVTSERHCEDRYHRLILQRERLDTDEKDDVPVLGEHTTYEWIETTISRYEELISSSE